MFTATVTLDGELNCAQSTEITQGLTHHSEMVRLFCAGSLGKTRHQTPSAMGNACKFSGTPAGGRITAQKKAFVAVSMVNKPTSWYVLPTPVACHASLRVYCDQAQRCETVYSSPYLSSDHLVRKQRR